MNLQWSKLLSLYNNYYIWWFVLICSCVYASQKWMCYFARTRASKSAFLKIKKWKTMLLWRDNYDDVQFMNDSGVAVNITQAVAFHCYARALAVPCSIQDFYHGQSWFFLACTKLHETWLPVMVGMVVRGGGGGRIIGFHLLAALYHWLLWCSMQLVNWISAVTVTPAITAASVFSAEQPPVKEHTNVSVMLATLDDSAKQVLCTYLGEF